MKKYIFVFFLFFSFEFCICEEWKEFFYDVDDIVYKNKKLGITILHDKSIQKDFKCDYFVLNFANHDYQFVSSYSEGWFKIMGKFLLIKQKIGRGTTCTSEGILVYNSETGVLLNSITLSYWFGNKLPEKMEYKSFEKQKKDSLEITIKDKNKKIAVYRFYNTK